MIMKYHFNEKSNTITRPSILCVTQKRAFMPLYIVLGQYKLVVLGIRWYRVSKGMYILEKMEIWSGDTDA